MRIDKLILNNFRNHKSSEICFSPNINVIWGNNGAGKTSILEAISICSISKSFGTNTEHSLVNKNSNFYTVLAYCTNELELPYKIKVHYSPRTVNQTSSKQISSTLGDNLRPKDIIGEIPLVVLSPDNKNITNSVPEHRRKFVDGILCQSNRYYLDKLYEIRRILKQRNALLQSFNKNQSNSDNNYNNSSQINLTNANQQHQLFKHWTDLLIDVSSDIIIRRKSFIDEFNPLFMAAYRLISNSKETVKVIYSPNLINKFIDDFDFNELSNSEIKERIKTQLNIKSNELREREIKRNTTLFGPQKDEFSIMINNNNNNNNNSNSSGTVAEFGVAKEFASQGQHKSILIALKFAEFQYLASKKSETPIILFDDIFSELDKTRVNRVIDLLAESKAQIFITLTESNLIELNSHINKMFIRIENGTVIEN